jgi:hypothetical protein
MDLVFFARRSLSNEMGDVVSQGRLPECAKSHSLMVDIGLWLEMSANSPGAQAEPSRTLTGPASPVQQSTAPCKGRFSFSGEEVAASPAASVSLSPSESLMVRLLGTIG